MTSQFLQQSRELLEERDVMCTRQDNSIASLQAMVSDREQLLQAMCDGIAEAQSGPLAHCKH